MTQQDSPIREDRSRVMQVLRTGCSLVVVGLTAAACLVKPQGPDIPLGTVEDDDSSRSFSNSSGDGKLGVDGGDVTVEFVYPAEAGNGTANPEAPGRLYIVQGDANQEGAYPSLASDGIPEFKRDDPSEPPENLLLETFIACEPDEQVVRAGLEQQNGAVSVTEPLTVKGDGRGDCHVLS